MALTDNKAKIQALLAGINALPEAGSGEPAEPVLQEKSVTPTKATQSVTPDTGYDGLSKVNVGAIPDEYIVPSGTVDITANGTHDVREAESVNVNVSAPEVSLQGKTVTPATTAQTVEPDSGYDGLSAVTVEKIPSDYVIPTGEKSITANGTHDVAGFASVNVAVEGGGAGGTNVDVYNLTFHGSAAYVEFRYTKLTENGLEKIESEAYEPFNGAQLMNVAKNTAFQILVEPNEEDAIRRIVRLVRPDGMTEYSGETYQYFTAWIESNVQELTIEFV